MFGNSNDLGKLARCLEIWYETPGDGTGDGTTLNPPLAYKPVCG